VAELAKDPKDWQLEDFVSAHFTSRGCYVETCIVERSPVEILELDIVWTDYREEREEPHPVEVKSGAWGFGEIFKFYGWTQYLGLKPGQFIHKQSCGRSDPASIKHVEVRTGIQFLHAPGPQDVELHLKTIGLPEPAWAGLPQLWRYSFWARRRFTKSLSLAIELGVCPLVSKAAKEYRHLINDAVFFIPNVGQRVERLLSAHFKHPQLARSAAYERETGKVDFGAPPSTVTFSKALYYGAHIPVQACMYLKHRARLYIMKALVDYWLAQERGEIKEERTATVLRAGKLILPSPPQLSKAMRNAIKELSAAKSFRLFPVFWQVFLWSWGGFLLKDRREEEYALLARETGVREDEIPIALSAFDKIFPIAGGWFKEVNRDSRHILMLMPPAMRGIGAYRRKLTSGVESYQDLGYKDATCARLADDHNAVVRLLDGSDAELVK
jgi:hypothetical protein